MRILVLGGYGFLGSHICQKLKQQKHVELWEFIIQVQAI